MKTFKILLFWGGGLTGAYSAGYFLFSKWLKPDQFSSLLKVLGLFFSIAGAMIAVLLKVYVDQPHKELSERKKRRFRIMQDLRLRIMWTRTGFAFVLSVTAAFCGWLIDSKLLSADNTLNSMVQMVEGIGTMVSFAGLLLAVVSFIEARRISLVVRNVATVLEERKAKIAALHRLG